MKSLKKSILKKLKRIWFWFKDIRNNLIYGKNAPKSAQLIFVNPYDIKEVIFPNIFSRKKTGSVISGDWDTKTTSLVEHKKYIFCLEHFKNGKSWEESGAYEHMHSLIKAKPGMDSCYTTDDIAKRYQKIDEIYFCVKNQGVLLTRGEIKKHNFREEGGIYIHLGRNAEPIFGGGGCHRLAIAKILNLKMIPVQLGVVHREAVYVWKSKYNCQ